MTAVALFKKQLIVPSGKSPAKLNDKHSFSLAQRNIHCITETGAVDHQNVCRWNVLPGDDMNSSLGMADPIVTRG